jgi:dimethylamine/trimethylamine dehydrogenase
VLTPDDLMRGARPGGSVVLFDDDHYYMGPVLAMLLAQSGARVTYVTTEGKAGDWSHYTGEQENTQRAMLEAGIAIIANSAVHAFDGGSASLACVYTGRASRIEAGTLVLVTSREPDDRLYRELAGDEGERDDGRIERIGDCLQPAIIANAVYSGHKAARELGDAQAGAGPQRDRAVI